MQLSLFNLIKPLLPSSRSEGQKRVRISRPSVSQVSRENSADLSLIWKELQREYFPERQDLDVYTIVWSSRPQKRTLASCNIERKRVIVARELNYSEWHIWLSPLIYHEMCHAVLGFSVFSEEGRSAWHGAEFRALEQQHPLMKRFDNWVKDPRGWSRAVRSDRSRRAHNKRKRILVS